MEYKRAAPSDADALARLRVLMLCENASHAEAFKTLLYSNTLRYLTDGMERGTLAAFFAEEEGVPVATGLVCFFSLPPNDWCPGGKSAYVGNMFTLPAYRGKGAAKRILSLLVGEAKNRGCERVLLHATDAGRPLYEHGGFKPSPTAMALYPFGVGDAPQPRPPSLG